MIVKNSIVQQLIKARLSVGLLSALAALPLLASAGCGVDSPDSGDEDIASESSAILGACHILVPYGWQRNGFPCRGGYVFANNGAFDLAPGATVQINDFKMFGYVQIKCHSNGDGGWDEVAKACTNHEINVPGPNEPS